MWSTDQFGRAAGPHLTLASSLRRLIVENEADDSRIPRITALSAAFGTLCVPFKEHSVDLYADDIYEAVARAGEDILLFDNPLYEPDSRDFFVAAPTDPDSRRILRDERFFEGAFVIATLPPLFRWIGNFTDYGFLFTTPEMVRAIFNDTPGNVYRSSVGEFATERETFLREELDELDALWAASGL